MKVSTFIQSIRDEKNGFSLDQPWRLDESSLFAIVPILRVTKAKRSYITFAEALAVQVEDTGQIDYVHVKNNEDKPVFISRGDIFRGKTQERAATHGHIVMPGKSMRVAVRCIHASRGISGKAEMKYAGNTPYDITTNLGRSQRHTWDSISNYTMCAGFGTTRSIHSGATCFAGTPTMDSVFDSRLGADDLKGTLDNLSDAMKTAMKKIPHIDNQVGSIFFGDSIVKGISVYDVPVSWDAVKKEMVEKEGASFLKKDDANLFEFKPEKAKELVAKRLSDDFDEKVLYSGEYQVIELRGNDLGGEATIFKDKVIHLTLWALS